MSFLRLVSGYLTAYSWDFATGGIETDSLAPMHKLNYYYYALWQAPSKNYIPEKLHLLLARNTACEQSPF
jgi:hypothetical protein